MILSIAALLLLFAALELQVSAELVNTTEIRVAQNAVNGLTELIIYSELQGNIEWHSGDDGDDIYFIITKFGQSYLELNKIMITTTDKNSQLILRATPTTSDTTTGSAQAVANFFILVVCLLFTSVTGIVLFDKHYGSKLFLFCIITIIVLSSGVIYVTAQSVLGVHIEIHVPRNYSFKSVRMTSLRGAIKADSDLIESETLLHCESGNIPEACPSCCSANGQCVNGACQCSVGYRNGTSNCAQQSEATLNIHTNPNDPIIVTANTPDGDKIALIGEKDSNGMATKVERIQLTDSEGNSTYAQLDQNNTLSSAIHSSGMLMDFKWNNESNYTRVQVIVVLPGSSQQYIIGIDLLSNKTALELDDLDLENDQLTKRSIDDEKHSPLREMQEPKQNLEMTKNFETLSKIRSKKNVQTSNSARVSIDVQSCESPDNEALVEADVKYDDTTVHYIALLSNIPGRYYVYIPTKTSSMIGEAIGEACSAIEMVLDTACSWYSKLNSFLKYFTKHKADKLLCYYLGNGLKLIAPQLRLIPIYRFCKTVFKGVDYYCDNINAPVVKDLTEKRRSELICELITEHVDNTIDSFRDTDVTFTPSALFQTGNKITGRSRVITLTPGGGNVATVFTIADDSSLQITSLFVNPVDPAPRENYLVTVFYKCYTSSTRVSMTIIGTDGYYDVRYCNGGPSCNLPVPGGAALVRDTVTVTITDTSVNQIITRQVFVIF